MAGDLRGGGGGADLGISSGLKAATLTKPAVKEGGSLTTTVVGLKYVDTVTGSKADERRVSVEKFAPSTAISMPSCIGSSAGQTFITIGRIADASVAVEVFLAATFL